jgi:hypothetical protein
MVWFAVAYLSYLHGNLVLATASVVYGSLTLVAWGVQLARMK